jgi:peptidylprolyl isomerase
MVAMLRGALLTVFLCAALALAACGGGDSTSGGGETEAAAKPAESSESAGSAGSTKSKPKVEIPEGEPPTELVTEEIVEGEGAEAKKGDEVTVQYVGVGYESEEQFDASWDRGEPFPFTLGAKSVIPGWEQGVEGMKEGGRRKLIIPPELAYGERGAPPAIGPNETLVFVVDLVSVN